MSTLAMPSQRPIEDARERADQVKRDLEVVGAELGLSHEALERNLPPETKRADVAWALDQNAAAEEKVLQAAEELELVTELLRQEEAERERLEQQLAECERGRT